MSYLSHLQVCADIKLLSYSYCDCNYNMQLHCVLHLHKKIFDSILRWSFSRDFETEIQREY